VLRHLPEVSQIGANDWYPIRACQMGNTTATGRGRIWHDGDSGTLKQPRQRVLRNVAAEFDSRISCTLLPDRFRVARCLRMVSAGNHQLCLGQLRGDEIERFNHQFETFVGSPLAERQNAMDGSSPPGEIWKFRPPRQNAVRTQVDIVSAVLVIQDLAITRHQHGN